MILSYPKSEWSRAGAWADVLRRRPAWGTNGRLWRPSDRDFRKDHNRTHWRWYVQRWRGPTPRSEDGPPPPIEISIDPTRYVPSEWTEYDGTQDCGFALAITIAGETVVLE